MGLDLLVWLGIWLGAGAICGISEMYCEWHRGCDVELKDIAVIMVVSSIGGFITCFFMLGSAFKALLYVLESILSPLNFTIKGRKQK